MSRKSDSNSSSSYEQDIHSIEVNKLRASLENTKQLIEEQQLTSKLHARQIEENAQQMEQIKKMIEKMSQAQREPWTLDVHIF